MKYGFIYISVDALNSFLNYLNLVELFKAIASRLTPTNADDDTRSRYRNIAIDVFIVMKWVTVICFWYLSLESFWVILVTCYLVATNMFTYFLNHVWDENPHRQTMTLERSRRRFVSLMLAVAFSCLCYAYLYNVPYARHFSWPVELTSFWAAIHFSVTNSFGGNFDGIQPLTDAGSILMTTQQLATFTFVAIILTKSIPATNREP